MVENRFGRNSAFCDRFVPRSGIQNDARALATATYHGHPDGLVDATRDLLAWGDEQGLEWDSDGAHWTARLEIYLSDPREVPDMKDWDTELQFKLKD